MAKASNVDPDVIATGFHALSDPIRAEIVMLLQNGERCVCDLMVDLDAAQSRLSFHLKVLKEAGIVTDRRQGRWSYYTLNPDALAKLQGFLGNVVTVAERTRSRSLKLASCC